MATRKKQGETKKGKGARRKAPKGEPKSVEPKRQSPKRLCRYVVEVTHRVEVDIDPEKINEAFMAEFREDFYDFFTLERHAEHVAQMFARGLYATDTEMVEGYGIRTPDGWQPGSLRDSGIVVRISKDDCEAMATEITPPRTQ